MLMNVVILDGGHPEIRAVTDLAWAGCVSG